MQIQSNCMQYSIFRKFYFNLFKNNCFIVFCFWKLCHGPAQSNKTAQGNHDPLLRRVRHRVPGGSPGSVNRKNLISYLMRKNEEIRGKRLGQL
jgi:hypothetical protein